MKLFTEEWFNGLVEALKKDEEFQDMGKFFNKKVHVRILKDPKAGLNKNVAFGGLVPTGDSTWYGDKSEDEVDLIMQGKAGDFLKVVTGEEHPTMALGKGGSIELVKGRPEDLLPQMGLIMKLFEVMKSVSG